MLLICWHIIFGIDRIDRTLWHAYSTINTLCGINDQKIRTSFETVHRTHIHTVGVPASYTGFSYNISHLNRIMAIMTA